MLFVVLLLCIHRFGPATGSALSTIRWTDQAYRKYVGKQDPQQPWHDGVDVLTKRGFEMTPVQVSSSCQHHGAAQQL